MAQVNLSSLVLIFTIRRQLAEYKRQLIQHQQLAEAGSTATRQRTMSRGTSIGQQSGNRSSSGIEERIRSLKGIQSFLIIVSGGTAGQRSFSARASTHSLSNAAVLHHPYVHMYSARCLGNMECSPSQQARAHGAWGVSSRAAVAEAARNVAKRGRSLEPAPSCTDMLNFIDSYETVLTAPVWIVTVFPAVSLTVKTVLAVKDLPPPRVFAAPQIEDAKEQSEEWKRKVSSEGEV